MIKSTISDRNNKYSFPLREFKKTKTHIPIIPKRPEVLVEKHPRLFEDVEEDLSEDELQFNNNCDRQSNNISTNSSI